MPKWIVVLLVAGCLCAPAVAIARSDPGGAEVRLAASGLDGDILGIPKEQAAVVGAGIVAGALVLHLLVPGDFTYFAGGVIGGLAALWWYENEHAKKRPALKVDLAGTIRNAGAGPVLEAAAPTR
jgi:hypothetical protein